MHSPAVKQKVLAELTKTGNIYTSCMKAGVDRSTFYRWLEKDEKFKKAATKAIELGNLAMVDIAEHALMLRIKSGDLGAIKYLLSHRSAIYKRSAVSQVIIEHRRGLDPNTNRPPTKTIEDLLDELELYDPKPKEE